MLSRSNISALHRSSAALRTQTQTPLTSTPSQGSGAREKKAETPKHERNHLPRTPPPPRAQKLTCAVHNWQSQQTPDLTFLREPAPLSRHEPATRVPLHHFWGRLKVGARQEHPRGATQSDKSRSSKGKRLRKAARSEVCVMADKKSGGGGAGGGCYVDASHTTIRSTQTRHTHAKRKTNAAPIRP